MELVQNIAGSLTPYAYETITVSTAAVGLAANKIAPSDFKTLGKARLVRIFVEAAKVRFRDDGSSDESGPNPTGTNGQILNAGDVYTIGNLGQMQKFKVIRHGDEVTDAVLRVTYFR